VTAVSIVYPNVVVARETVEPGAATALTRVARGADVLVLGSRGHSRLYHAVVGSVTEQCMRAAACPVVVVLTPHRGRVAKPAEVQVST
jgi:nucleotide-binding universal stress UspA family protein